jgi:hypothetical protein
MGGLGDKTCEVLKCIVSTGSLRVATVSFHLDGMNQVGEFNRILYEENRAKTGTFVPTSCNNPTAVCSGIASVHTK